MKDPVHDEGSSRDARLTDYLCGELDAAGVQALEAELARDAELRARLEELRRAFAWVREEAPPPPAQLGDARRAALRAAAAEQVAARAAARDGHLAGASAAPRAGRLLRFPLWARAAAGLVVAVGLFALGRGMLEPEALTETADLFTLGYVDDTHARGAWSNQAAPASEPLAAATIEESAAEPPELRAMGYLGYDGSGAPSTLRLQPWAEDKLALGQNFVEPILPQTEAGLGLFHLAPAAPAVAAELAEIPFDPNAALALDSTSALVLPPDLDTAGRGVAGGERKDVPGERAGVSSLGAPSRESGARAGFALGGGGAATGGLHEADRFGVDELDAAICALTDGYGRRYVDRGVLEHLRRQDQESPRDMFFRYYGDHAVVRADEDALSTFAADVDTASYALVRAYVAQGDLPPKAAVRTEECVNSFAQELAPPQEGDFALTLEAAPSPYGDENALLLRCGLKAREVSRAERKPLNLVFVVDKSGSMEKENRIGMVREALELLVDQVRDDDTIGLIAFDAEGHEILPPTAGAERWKIREALRSIQPGGSTNAAAGLFLGYAMAERAFRAEAVNRVVLASDGVANTGETDQQRILERIRRRAEVEVDLTTIGVGMGNHNDAFLERMADEGEGSCHYVDSLEEAKRVLVDGFTGAMQVVAREARVQVEFDPAVVSEWRQLGYENRALADRDFRNDRVDAGEIGAGHEMVALYEVVLAPGADRSETLATLRMRWKPDGASAFVERAASLRVGQTRRSWEDASPRLRLNGAVAQFAEFLRRSVHARGEDYGKLRAEAGRLAREFARDPQVGEFRDLVERAESIARRAWPEDELSLLIDEARRARLAECELESRRKRDARAEELLREVRLQNAEIERKLGEILERPR